MTTARVRAGGSGATNAMPCTVMSSAVWFMPSSASPAATSSPAGAPPAASLSLGSSCCGDAPALEQAGEVVAGEAAQGAGRDRRSWARREARRGRPRRWRYRAFGAPARTTAPIEECEISTMLPGIIRPRPSSTSSVGRAWMMASAATPPSIFAIVAAAPCEMKVIRCPVACSNCGFKSSSAGRILRVVRTVMSAALTISCPLRSLDHPPH